MSGTAFSAALRQAISGSGLGLDRIQARLQERGISVSVTALSYWQSGKRQPERQSSISAVRVLEEILDVPAGSLLGLLAPPRPRGAFSRRRSDDNGPLAFEEDPGLALVGLHDRCDVGADGTPRTVTGKAVFRAGADGPDRWLLTCRGAPDLRALRNCAIGRTRVDTERGVTLAELLFGRCLGSGETHLVEYSLGYEHTGEDARAQSHFHEFAAPVPEYLIEVYFPAEASPGRCWQYARAGEPAADDSRDLRIDDGGAAHAVALDFGPGVFGVAWAS